MPIVLGILVLLCSFAAQAQTLLPDENAYEFALQQAKPGEVQIHLSAKAGLLPLRFCPLSREAEVKTADGVLEIHLVDESMCARVIDGEAMLSQQVPRVQWNAIREFLFIVLLPFPINEFEPQAAYALYVFIDQDGRTRKATEAEVMQFRAPKVAT